MKAFIFLGMVVLVLAGCSKSEPPLVGKMSVPNICSTAGYLIRQNLGDKFKTTGVECVAKKLEGNQVEIASGYVSPFGPMVRYTAIGEVDGNKLRLQLIKVDGADEEFIPFGKFPNG